MLPVVSQDLIPAKLKSISTSDSVHIYKQIKTENPALWIIIEAVIDSDEHNEQFKDGFCRAAAIFYGLLSSQQEVDEFNKAWGGAF